MGVIASKPLFKTLKPNFVMRTAGLLKFTVAFRLGRKYVILHIFGLSHFLRFA